MKKIELKSFDIDFKEYTNDAGVTYEANCPNCGDTIKVATNGWWDTDCSCGYTWSLKISIVGEK